MEELDPKAKQLIDAYREAKSAPGGASGRVWNRVEQSTAAGASASLTLAKVGIGAALIAGLVLWGWPRDEVRAPQPTTPTQEVAVPPVPDAVPELPAPAAPTAPIVETPPLSPPAAEVPEEAATVKEESPAPARSKQPKPAEPAPTELELIARAKKALAAGRAKAALAATGQHGKLYPDGTLLEERSLLEIEARCALGQTDRVERLRESFLKTHAGSPLADRVRHSCQE